jgi:putative transposase
MVVRKRLNIKGRALAFVTTTAHNWASVFEDGQVAATVVDQLRQSVAYHGVSLVGYVLMPSHLHMLLGFREIEKLSRFMQGFKILSAKAVKGLVPDRFKQALIYDGSFRLWRPRFDDLIITSEEQFRIKLNYIHNNPVKAGLVANASQWIYSSATDWLGGEPGILPIDKDFNWLD